MAGDYGFVLNVGGNSIQQMKLIEEAVRKLGGTVKSATSEIADGFASLGESARELQSHLIEAFSVYEIYNFGKELLHLTAEFQGFENVIKGSSMGIVDGQRDLYYLNDAITRLHLPMQQAYEGFSEMEAGFYGTTIQGEKLRHVFEGLSEISLTKHLKPDQFSRAIYAMKEIGELGTLQARQLKMLALAVPGAGVMAAEAMGVSMAKLHEKMKKGEVKADDFLPKLADIMMEVAQPSLKNAADSLLSQINDEQNSVIQSMRDMGDSLMPLWSDILKTTITFMRDIQSLWSGLTGNSNFVNFLKEVFDWAAKLIPIWLTYKGVMWVVGIATESQIFKNAKLILSMGSLEDMAIATGIAMEGLQAAIADIGFGALGIGIGLAIEDFIEWNQKINDTADGLTRINEITSKFQEANKVANDVQLAASNWKNLSAVQKKSLVNDASQGLKMAVTDTAKFFDPILRVNKKRADSINTQKAGKNDWGESDMPGSQIDSLIKTSKRYEASVDSSKTAVLGMSKNIELFKDILKKGKAEKIIPSTDIFGSTGTSGKDQAYSTSNLAGASGGLGSARTIKIDFHGPFQQNVGVKESKNEADAAIEKMIEMLDGFSSSQNSI